ncbi:hypothetical protein MUDAN_DOGOELCO_03214 [Lactiplantibacillus mudanjiangensis]|nr:hypothetical protein MUDAN_DOGOELCO_03214 [Lactiplantibacillus mudanjiangensis]
MAIDVKITDNNDFPINDDGTVPMVEGVEELAQAVRIRLGIPLGGWQIDPEVGLDRDSLMTRPFDEELATDAIRNCVLQDERIDSLNAASFEFDPKTRQMTYSIELTAKSQNFSVTDTLGV